MTSTSSADEPEQLREALLDLERANSRERDIRLEAEALLSGLRVLTDHDRRDTMFGDLLQLLRGLLGFDDAVILLARDAAEMHAVASTSPRFEDVVWARGNLVDRMSLDQVAENMKALTVEAAGLVEHGDVGDISTITVNTLTLKNSGSSDSAGAMVDNATLKVTTDNLRFEGGNFRIDG